jgi:enoyl-CoA hydratase/carnithine racemase
VLDYKLSSPNLIRSAALEGTRFTAEDLHALGIVDVIAEDIIPAARSLAKLRAPLAKTGVWGLMKVGTTTPFHP